MVPPLGTMDHLPGLVIRELPLQGATKDAEKWLCTSVAREPFSGAGSCFREPPLRGPFSGAAPESLKPLFEAVSHDYIKRT